MMHWKIFRGKSFLSNFTILDMNMKKNDEKKIALAIHNLSAISPILVSVV